MKFIEKYRIRKFIEEIYNEYGLCINSVSLLFLLISAWIVVSMITGEYDQKFFFDYVSKACKYSFIVSAFLTE